MLHQTASIVWWARRACPQHVRLHPAPGRSNPRAPHHEGRSRAVAESRCAPSRPSGSGWRVSLHSGVAGGSLSPRRAALCARPGPLPASEPWRYRGGRTGARSGSPKAERGRSGAAGFLRPTLARPGPAERAHGAGPGGPPLVPAALEARGGPILARVLLEASHESQRFPHVQDGGSAGRRVQWATASGGPRAGTAGQTSGHASLTWACCEAAVWCLRTQAAGHPSRARLAKTPGHGQAWTMRAPHRARAVYARRKRAVAFARATCLHGARQGVGEPGVSLDGEGRRLSPTRGPLILGGWARGEAPRPTLPEPYALLGPALPLWQSR